MPQPLEQMPRQASLRAWRVLLSAGLLLGLTACSELAGDPDEPAVVASGEVGKESDKHAREKQEREKQEREKQEREKLEREKQEREKQERERLEREKQEREKREREKLEREKHERERLEREKQEREKLEREKREREKLEREKQEREKLEREKQEREKQEREKLEREKREREKLEREKQEREKQEREKQEREKQEREKQEREKQEREKQEREKLEREKQEREKLERERQERERLERERKEREEEERKKRANTPIFSIGGQVSGLASGRNITLSMASGEEVPVNNNGTFRFTKLLKPGERYQVEVARQPLWQFCEVRQGAGQATSSIHSVAVHCTDAVAEVSVLAGSGEKDDAEGQGAGASFGGPSGVAVDARGHVYVADRFNHRVRKILPGGQVTTLAESGEVAFADGHRAEASFNNPSDVAVDHQGNVYVADWQNHRIRKITPGGQVTILAGSGEAAFADGQGIEASFNEPFGLDVDQQGHVYVADLNNHRIRKITPDGQVTTLAGSGNATFADGQGDTASFNEPSGVAVDLQGRVYVADWQNHRIRKITPDGQVTTLAGSDNANFADGQGANASFNEPMGVAVDLQGYVYVADSENRRIRRISPSGTVTTLAGSGEAAFADGTGFEASFNTPTGVAVDLQGHVYVADFFNHRIRKISPVKAR